MTGQTMPLPDTRLYRTMAAGHETRTGHELRAHLASEDGEIWRVVRECCDVKGG